MTENNLYQRLVNICENNEILDLKSGVSEIDDCLMDEFNAYFRKHVDLNALSEQLFDETARIQIRHSGWRDIKEEAMSRLNRIVWNEVGTEVVNKGGKFNVRFKKMLRAQYKLTVLSDDDFCKLSTIFGDWREKSRLKYDFTDTFDWNDGDFGDDGSCYWGDRAAARDTLEHYHALAVRFYKRDQNDERYGVGRAWVAPIMNRISQDGAVVVFNRYGVPRTMDDVVMAITNLDPNLQTTHVHLVNKGSSCDTLYANGDAVVISYDEYPYDKLDLNYSIVRGQYDQYCNEGCYCDSCGDRVDEGDGYNVGDDTLCEGCYEDQAGYCERCGGTYYNDDLNELANESGRVCDYCAHRYHYNQCDFCDGYSTETQETTSGRIVCEGCASDMTLCDCCDKFIDEDSSNVNDATSLDLSSRMYPVDVHLCDSCTNDHVYECEVCGKHIYDPDNSERTVCQDCEKVHVEE